MTLSEPVVRPSAPESRDLVDWQVRPTAGPVPEELLGAFPIPAVVPGTVHTDLMARGLIEDPYEDSNELAIGWIGSTGWVYTTEVAPFGDEAERVDLVLDGVDTVAEIRMTGATLGHTSNQFRSYRFDVTGRTRETATLEVEFTAPVPYADAMSLELGYRPQVNKHPYNTMRKMASNFGWDWGPDLSTCGLWRGARLHAWSTARLAAVHPLATLEGADGHVRLRIEVERTTPGEGETLGLEVRLAGSLSVLELGPGMTRGEWDLVVPDVEVWQPVGRGVQALHDLEVELTDGSGTRLDRWRGEVGFRTVELDTTADEVGHRFTLRVNGEDVFVRGANWIPDDAFPHRVGPERYRRRLEQAAAANINLLRVWGGGLFETEEFYEICDELGILVWQDFPFACAAYAEEEPMWSEVEAEARENIPRLAAHVSLVLWNGSNENLVGFADWGWPARLEGRTWGLRYYTDLLPRLVAELDGSRPYIPSSPWSVDDSLHPNDVDNGSTHLWRVWNDLDYTHLRDYRTRFAAEYGWQAPATWSALKESISDDPLTPESPGMWNHQKALGGNDKLTDGLVPHLRLPDSMEDWHWAMQLNQALALEVGITHLRSLAPLCAGSVVWQLNDMWPVTSWAIIDGYGREKPAYYALRHAYAERLVSVQPRGDGLVVAISNDSPEPWEEKLVLTRRAFDGSVISSSVEEIRVEARGTALVPIGAEVAAAAEPTAEFIVAEYGAERGTWFFEELRDLDLAEEDLSTTVSRTGDGYNISVTAHNLVLHLTLLADKVDPDAQVEDTLETLLPGETTVVHVRTQHEVDGAELTAPQVLRTANQLVVVR